MPSGAGVWGGKTPFTLLDQPGLQAEPRSLTPHTQLPLDEVCEAGILSGYDELSAFAGSAEVN
jgi:hypothetical protein